jgi:hypothetical protein
MTRQIKNTIGMVINPFSSLLNNEPDKQFFAHILKRISHFLASFTLAVDFLSIYHTTEISVQRFCFLLHLITKFTLYKNMKSMVYFIMDISHNSKVLSKVSANLMNTSLKNAAKNPYPDGGVVTCVPPNENNNSKQIRPTHCLFCGKPLVRKTRTNRGRFKRFCNNNCDKNFHLNVQYREMKETALTSIAADEYPSDSIDDSYKRAILLHWLQRLNLNIIKRIMRYYDYVWDSGNWVKK